MALFRQSFFDGSYQVNGITVDLSHSKISVDSINYCHPTKYLTTETTKFSSAKFTSFDYFVENASNRIFKFEPSNGDEIEFETKVFINKDDDGNDHKVVKDESGAKYSWGFKANWGSCYLLETLIKIPKSLTSYDGVDSRISNGPIEGDFSPELNIKKFILKSNNSKINLKDLNAETFDLDLNNGRIELNELKSNTANINSNNVDLVLKKAEIDTSLNVSINNGHARFHEIKTPQLQHKVNNGDFDLDNSEVDNLRVKLINGKTILHEIKTSNFQHKANNGNLEGSIDNAEVIDTSFNYGKTNLRVNSFKDPAKSVQITSKTSGGSHSFFVDNSFRGKFELNLNYGQSNLKSDPENTHFTKNLRWKKQGYIGDGSGKGSIILNSNYGNLNLDLS